MYCKLTTAERLKDLRVVDKKMTLEEVAEQTGLSRSALGQYESDDAKEISSVPLITLAKFYGVSTDYLLGLTENKKHPNTEVQALHLSDGMLDLLSGGKIKATPHNTSRAIGEIIFVIFWATNRRNTLCLSRFGN